MFVLPMFVLRSTLNGCQTIMYLSEGTTAPLDRGGVRVLQQLHGMRCKMFCMKKHFPSLKLSLTKMNWINTQTVLLLCTLVVPDRARFRGHVGLNIWYHYLISYTSVSKLHVTSLTSRSEMFFDLCLNLVLRSFPIHKRCWAQKNLD